MLEQMNSDVVCLQEVMFTAFESDFAPFFARLGFDAVMQSSNSRASTHQTGNATFFRRSKFALEWEDHRSRTLLVGLRMLCRDTAHHVAVANVHLEGHHLAHDKRFQQLQSTLKQLAKRHTQPDSHAIVTGDFNHSLSESVAAMLLDGAVPACCIANDNCRPARCRV